MAMQSGTARSLEQEKKDYSHFTHQTHADLTGKPKTVKVPGTNQTRELK